MSPAARIPERAWLIAALLTAAIAVGTALLNDWIPLDEGSLSLSARYVNAGYLPHRDFTYPYIGGLAFLGALTMQVFGDTMVGARWVLFAAFLPWLWAMWGIARRVCAPEVAAIVVVLAAAWTLLIYPAALPSWYLLFLVTGTVLALLRWSEGGSPRWVILAGLLCGLSLTLKQTGLYALIAGGLGVLAVRQARAGEAGNASPNPVVLALLTMGFVAPAFLVVRKGVRTGDALLVAVPVAAVLVSLILRERRLGSGVSRELYASWGRFLAGAAVFPLVLLAVYAARGGVGAAIEGMLRESARTVGFIESDMPPVGLILARGLPVGLVTAMLLRFRPSRMHAALSALAAAVAFAIAWMTDPGYQAVWHFATLLVPAVACSVVWLEARRDPGRGDSVALPVVAAAMALQGLHQFPLPAANYFAYVAPLAMLLVAMVASWRGVERRLTFAALLLLAFALRFHRIGDTGTLGFGPVWRETTHALPGPHAGVFASREDSTTYARLLELVRAHGGPDSLAAGPELPALYVLSGTQRLVRQPFLLVDDERADSTAMAAQLDVAATRSVAIQHEPLFVPRIAPEAAAWLAARYPNAERVGTIEFRWR